MNKDRSETSLGVNPHTRWQASILPSLSLFSSFSTLLCCALPALLVTLGAGATLAGLVAHAPWWVALSQYKHWTFAISGGLLVMCGVFLWHGRRQPCPVNPEQAQACQRLRRVNHWVYGLSLAVWVVGFFFAFLASDLLL